MAPPARQDPCDHPPLSCELRFSGLEKQSNEILESVKTIETIVGGGDKPSDGLIVRFDRVEQFIKEFKGTRDMMRATVVGAIATILLAAAAVVLQLWRLHSV